MKESKQFPSFYKGKLVNYSGKLATIQKEPFKERGKYYVMLHGIKEPVLITELNKEPVNETI